MHEQEEVAIKVIEKQFEMFDKIIEAYRGKVIKTLGDGVLARFDSVVDAVECGIEIQNNVEEYNKGKPEEEQLNVRVAIHLGDTIIKNDDVFGNGVNIAARLVEIAEPGSITVSGTVYEQIKYKVSKLASEYSGKKRLKNIREPIPVYKILPQAKKEVPMKKAFGIAFVPAIIVAGGLFAFMHFYYLQLKEVPNLTGCKFDEIKPLSPILGFSIVVKSVRSDSIHEKGTIIEQIPQPGKHVKRGDTLFVVLSSGIEVTVPDVTGKPLSEAKLLLRTKKLDIGSVRYQTSSLPEGYVVSTEPKAGTKVSAGTKINLIVSKAIKVTKKKPTPRMVTVPKLINLSKRAAEEMLSSFGLKLGKITTVTDPDKFFDIIIDQNPKPGTKVPVGSKVDITINQEEE